MKLKKNLGCVDRIARIVIGIVLLGIVPLAFFGPEDDLALLGLFGVVPLTAGVVGVCPPYHWLGLDTVDGKRQRLIR